MNLPSPLLVLDLGGNLRITLGTGAVTSNLHVTDNDTDTEAYNAAIDGLEATLLALHEAGIDLSTEAARSAVLTAYEAIDNHHG